MVLGPPSSRPRIPNGAQTVVVNASAPHAPSVIPRYSQPASQRPHSFGVVETIVKHVEGGPPPPRRGAFPTPLCLTGRPVLARSTRRPTAQPDRAFFARGLQRPAPAPLWSPMDLAAVTTGRAFTRRMMVWSPSRRRPVASARDPAVRCAADGSLMP